MLSKLSLLSFLYLPLSSFAQQALTLQQIKDSALHNNIAMRHAQHSIDAAKEQRKEAFTKYFPNVSGTGLWFNANKGMAKMDINPSGMISPELGANLAQMLPAEALAALANPISISMMKNGTIGSLMAVQPVFAGGQIINGNKLAKVGEDVSRLQLQLSGNEVEKTAEQYFWQLASLQEKMKTIEAVDTLLAGIHKDVDVAVRAGLAMRNDLLQVQLRQNDIQSQRLKLQNGISIVRLLLSQYCGLRDTSFVISYQPDAPSTLLSRQDHDQALLGTAEYQLLGKQVEATNLQKKLAVGQNLPTVAVGAGYNYHNLLDNNHTFGMIFATVSVPISDWWGGSHAIKRRKIEHQQAQEQCKMPGMVSRKLTSNSSSLSAVLSRPRKTCVCTATTIVPVPQECPTSSKPRCSTNNRLTSILMPSPTIRTSFWSTVTPQVNKNSPTKLL